MERINAAGFGYRWHEADPRFCDGVYTGNCSADRCDLMTQRCR